MNGPCSIMRLASGSIGFRDSGGTGLPIVFVHGVCGSKEVFEHQYAAPLAGKFRLVAFDLPGHGASDDAGDAHESYSIRALTDATLDVMNYLRLSRALVVGWSLGGHIAMELMHRFPDRLAGVVNIGAPPIAPGRLALMRAFHLHPDLLLAGKARFTTRDAQKWQALCYGPAADGLHFAAILRTDGRMRPEISRSLMRRGISDQKRLVAASPVPLALINGDSDPILNLRYLKTLRYANLWEGRSQLIPGAGHAPFLSHPEPFNQHLHRFASEMARLYPGPYLVEKPAIIDQVDVRADEPRSPRRVAR